jgi:tRNA (guanine-N7-)-methyltransferase
MAPADTGTAPQATATRNPHRPERMDAQSGTRLRTVRSFVRREGRLTRGQQRALRELWPEYGIEAGAPVDLPARFGRRAPLTLEIGFGNGDTLLALAAAHPEQDFLGIEVHRPGVGHLLQALAQHRLENVRVMCGDAVDILRADLPAPGLQRILLLFPDPWHKQRHHKRRIVQPAFIALLAEKLADGGLLHLATDWADYANYMLEVVGASPALHNCAPDGRFVARPGDRPVTRFERRGLRRGHVVRDLMFRKTVPSGPLARLSDRAACDAQYSEYSID